MTLTEILEVRKHVTQTLDLLDQEILEYDWRHLVSRDLHVLGIRAYRKQNNDCSLREANDACDAFRNMIHM